MVYQLVTTCHFMFKFIHTQSHYFTFTYTSVSSYVTVATLYFCGSMLIYSPDFTFFLVDIAFPLYIQYR